MNTDKDTLKKMIEDVMGMDKEEIQCFKCDIAKKNGQPTWEIDVYCLHGDEEALINTVVAIDRKARECYLGLKSNFIPNMKLKNFNKYKDPTTNVTLERNYQGEYFCNVKCVSKINEEVDAVTKAENLRTNIMNLINM